MDGWTQRAVDAVPLAISAIVGAFVVVTSWGDGGPLLVPLAAWTAILVVFLVALACVSVLVERLPDPLVHPLFAVAVAGGVAMVVLAPGAAWVMIVLVFTALVSGYLGSLWLSASVVLVNSAAIVAASMLQGATAGSIALGTGIYLVLQANAVVFVRIVLRELDLRRELEVTNVRLRTAQALLDESSRADERVRIARDLHDVLGHRLTAIAIELEVASHTTSGDAHASVARARDVARAMLGDVRETVSALRAPAGDVEVALRTIADDVTSLEVDVAVEAGTLTAEQAETVVRCAQELVTNALRHAQASRLAIALRRDGEHLVLDAHDDGVGAAVVEPGNGLAGMRERVEGLGGSLVVDGTHGFRVTAVVPA